MSLTKEEAVQNFKTRCPTKDLYTLKSQDEKQEVIVQKLSRGAYKDFAHGINNPKDFNMVDVMEKALFSSLIYPLPVDFEAMLNEDPTLATSFGTQLVNLMNTMIDSSKKKL